MAFILGVEWKDCDVVAELLGIKTFLNEFVAYSELAKYIKNRTGSIVGGRTISVSLYVRGYSFERNCVLRRWESETLK